MGWRASLGTCGPSQGGGRIVIAPEAQNDPGADTPSAADAGLAVAMEPAALVLVDCQPSTLKWAMTNLIDNAIKYGRQARVTLQANAATVQIAIDDAGPGISEADPV